VINAAECEPYITCDDLLMRERAGRRRRRRIEIMLHIVARRVPDRHRGQQARGRSRACVRPWQFAEREPAEVVVVPTVYPSGGEKQLIRC
jgi:electron transport complex protein RnfC